MSVHRALDRSCPWLGDEEGKLAKRLSIAKTSHFLLECLLKILSILFLFLLPFVGAQVNWIRSN